MNGIGHFRENYHLPLEYPICQHNEQSPLDINTVKATQSSFTEYQFNGADAPHRMILELPEDGTSLCMFLV